MTQLQLFGDLAKTPDRKKAQRSGAFTDNMKLPVHRWFRYSAGFSAEWVEQLVQSYGKQTPRILDPFCGSGTTMVAAARFGARAIGFEQHPFVARITAAKLRRDVDTAQVRAAGELCIAEAKKSMARTPKSSSPLLLKCYSDENLVALEALKQAYHQTIEDAFSEETSELVWLALTSILRETSGAGTAQWQYVLPNKSKARVRAPFDAMQTRIEMFCNDLEHARDLGSGVQVVLQTDARNPDCDETFDLVITSPPYPNNYDYADATRLEMTFWEEISGWGDLQGTVRRHLVRSCSQHAAAERLSLDLLLSDPSVDPIRDELTTVCEALAEVRKTKGGKKTYHTMVAAYFVDLARVWESLRRLVAHGGHIAFVIGDSAPYGVYVPSDKWLGKLALANGFKSYHFEKLRDRNIKWKNRKHRVPLKEGILWVDG